MKKLLIFVVLFLLVGFASASHLYNDDVTYKETISKTYYNSHDNSATTRTAYAYYDNEDRYSTYDYRWGYSYRESEDYWNRYHDFDEVKVIKFDNKRSHTSYDKTDSYSGHGRYGQWDYVEQPRIQARYNSVLDRLEYRECYDHAPRGKLFYIKCD